WRKTPRLVRVYRKSLPAALPREDFMRRSAWSTDLAQDTWSPGWTSQSSCSRPARMGSSSCLCWSCCGC
ncbi:MAG: hypothetical protein AVDCRST_MAG42-2479, partial [uncultured Chthoniobacterales bacterium]